MLVYERDFKSDMKIEYDNHNKENVKELLKISNENLIKFGEKKIGFSEVKKFIPTEICNVKMNFFYYYFN